MRRILVILCLLSCGCALHRTGNWRFTAEGGGHVLIPPDVRQAGLARRTFTSPVRILRPCPGRNAIVIRGETNHARVTVSRDGLVKQPSASLAAWAWDWESAGCVAPGDGIKLATAISESLPLDPATAFGLLFHDSRQSSGMDLDDQTRLRVVSPVLRDPKLGILEAPTVTATDSGLTLTAKAGDNLLGYETSLYVLVPKIGQRGSSIRAVSSERHMISTGANERLLKPAIDYFDFPPEAAFYRFFYESWRNDFSALLIAAATPPELDRFTAKLEAGGSGATCVDLGATMCVQIPKDVALNPFVAVIVNGAEMLVSRGATLRQVILSARERNPDQVLTRLRVQKRWRGRLIRVQFDPPDPEILTLPVQGGEIVSWR